MAKEIQSLLYDGDKNPLYLGSLIKGGGAGSVYQLGDGKVVKLYHPTIDKAYYQRKVTAMLALAPHLSPVYDQKHMPVVQLAWPLSVVLDNNKRFAGFVMPELDIKTSIELEYILQERQAIANQLPVGLGAKMSLAANLCTLVAALHHQHHRIIDLKPINLRFYKESLYIALLDCDGFSIQGSGERFPANQFTLEYLAPEFQVSGKIPADQEEYQDCFALAVILFQLLNFGIHPYSGKPLKDNIPTDLPGRIRYQTYAYGLTQSRNMEPSPVSGHLQIPLEIRTLFERAFSGDSRRRPSAQEWAECLRRYALRSSGLIQVCAKNPQHQYFTGFACAACQRVALLEHVAAQSRQTPIKKAKTAQRVTKRRKHAAPRQTVVVFPPRQPVVMPRQQVLASIKSLVPSGPPTHQRMAFYAFLSAAIPVLIGWMMKLFAVDVLEKDYTQSIDFFNEILGGAYSEQWAIGLLSIPTFLVLSLVGLLLIALPFFIIIRGSNP